ncbi:DUF4184 family protein [Actinoplanes derwentensis]|uniref:DUF4184 family protein n=1 Tax=Actinoplanes derwentensis TaxID=113562 RepID=A0A1H1TWU6_9ACTN|nr:DUF4184 family protein [Actinoplanes derwentensis]GID85154.1 hypothetical protein Ade03nite_40780 [Actinoplanes derwentensis]SDS64406.1 protein of unknown function [Actinoplanes derwentensis]
MPSTFPTHPAAILPLKLWRPRWFDGVALAIGAASPDIAYLVDGSHLPVWPLSHQWHGLILFCLPVTLLGCLLTRRAAPVVAAHLPAGGPFTLRDYGALSVSGHRWWITVLSALIGAASHVLLDDLEQAVPFLEIPAHLAGLAGMLALAAVIGRRRLIHRWHGEAPTVPRQPARFWFTAVAVTSPLVAVIPFLPAAFLPHTTGVRLLAALALGLLAGAAVARPRRVPALD